jgi:pimeloyl-ACP methyl ester carboxylesterase
VAVAGLLAVATSAAAPSSVPAKPAAPAVSPRPAVQLRTLDVDGVTLFYREAGPPSAPTLLLLHGFPTSSHMFRNLIPELADRFHVVAPDYPGFGFSGFPSPKSFEYSFAHLAEVVSHFTERAGLSRYALYVQDYGAPIGFRLALLHPERVSALVVQNGNAYEEGLSKEWAKVRADWEQPTPAHRDALREWLGLEGLRGSYVLGLAPERAKTVAPETWTLDWALMSRPGNVDVQLDLFRDYRTNVALYPKFHEFFRTRKPPTLVTWGVRDPFFTRAGAEAFKRDVPDAELHFFEDGGHFALETHGAEIAKLMREFLGRRL